MGTIVWKTNIRKGGDVVFRQYLKVEIRSRLRRRLAWQEIRMIKYYAIDFEEKMMKVVGDSMIRCAWSVAQGGRGKHDGNEHKT